MNELKFGHRVIAWNEDKSKSFKGRFVFVESDKGFYEKPYIVLVGEDGLESFKNCELDPEAEEFLIGDEVEFSDDGENWAKGAYGGVNKLRSGNILHFDLYDYKWRDCCPYPQEEDDALSLIEKLKELGYSGSIHSGNSSHIFGERKF